MSWAALISCVVCLLTRYDLKNKKGSFFLRGEERGLEAHQVFNEAFCDRKLEQAISSKHSI